MRPRIRSIKPEALQHRKIGRLSIYARWLWLGMITQADDEGRLVADPGQLRIVAFGYDEDVSVARVSELLAEISSTGLVVLYEVDEVPYACFPSWREHQRVDHPSESRLPTPVQESNRSAQLRSKLPSCEEAIPAEVRRLIAERHGAKKGVPVRVRCHYCKSRDGLITVFSDTGWVHFQDLELDHVIPRAAGGQSTPDNLVLSCRFCNRSKGSRGLENDREISRELALDRIGSDRIGSDRIEEKPLLSATAPRGSSNGHKGVVPAGFPEFWEKYPRRVGKLDAVKAWTKLAPDPELRGRILAAVEAQLAWPAWTRDGGQFVPYPASWLRAERWADEPPAADSGMMGATPRTAGNAAACRRFVARGDMAQGELQ